MSTLIVAVASFFGFIIAYNTYGRWLSKKIFGLDPNAVVPSRELRDDVDYVPTRKEVIFGHHFTSIAGTGPIVGPAIAVFWGWLPALLWVLLGSVFIGAVQDFSSLVVSMRHGGLTVGEISGRVVSPTARILFLVVLLFALTVVLAIFGLVIALIFAFYPESVISVWIEIPLAVGIGLWVYKKNGHLLIPSLIALAVMYGAIWVGTKCPVDLSSLLGIPPLGEQLGNAVVIWTVILFIYCFVASVLPVWTLLQPRDYINSHELFLAMGLLVVGMGFAAITGEADLVASAPAVAAAKDIPADAPPIFPFLFITIACGAISGFHCMVSSGTSSKQVAHEPDAKLVGYGSMLLEAGLAVIVILACCAGVGMGVFERMGKGADYRYTQVVDEQTGEPKTHLAAWRTVYQPEVVVDSRTGKTTGGWANHQLKQKVGAFIQGGANFVAALGIPMKFAIGILAVLAASFAATTLDTATRLQRYVIQELGTTTKIKPLKNKYVATALALVVAGAVAIFSGKSPGAGGLVLWPLFGATNQMLAGLAFMIVVFYVARRNKPIWFAAVPMVLMLAMPSWAMLHQMFHPNSGWLSKSNWLLFGFGLAIQLLVVLMVVEGIRMGLKLRAERSQATP